MFPTVQTGITASTAQQHHEINYLGSKLKEAAKKRSEQVKAQAEQIYQTYSVKN